MSDGRISLEEIERWAREKRDLPSTVIEQLIQEINMLGGAVTINSDQWFGVDARGEIVDYQRDDVEVQFSTRFTGEDLTLLLVRTCRAWMAKWQEVTGRRWQIV